MCGIAGIFLSPARIPDASALACMNEVMRYRGPDDEGVYLAAHIGLAHRRLAIRDLSPAGHCPMASDNQNIQVIFNGEIYNWRELRDELIVVGRKFYSQSDAEVILRGYETWAEDVVPKLRGMFAIAIWDVARRRLLLARDRCGEKPLFYQIRPDGLVFASTIVALLDGTPSPGIDPEAIGCYLVHSFIPRSHTIWRGVSVLPPAHMLTIGVESPCLVHKYWDFPRLSPRKRSVVDCQREVERVLEDSVLRCLDADVPVGVYLSGGVDSSVVAAYAARHHHDLQAFSLGFTEEEYNEIPYAAQVAKHLGIDHHVVSITAGDVIECLPHLVRQYGQPFGDSSAVPSFFIARLARQKVKVALSGDGGDESFGGYWRMQSAVYAARFSTFVPKWARCRLIAPLSERLGRFGERLQRMNALSLADRGTGYTNTQSWYDCLADVAGKRLDGLDSRRLVHYRVGEALDRPEASVIQRVLYDDFQIQLPDCYLTKVDVASMAASLEVRAPFLDQNVIEMAWTLPDSVKLRWGGRKWLLKRIAGQLVPPEVVHRPKMGFTLPLTQWFASELGDWLESICERSVAAEMGWIRIETVRHRLREHRQGAANHSTRLWLILWLELWFRLMTGEEGGE